MDINKIVSDAGAYASYLRVKPREENVKPTESSPRAETQQTGLGGSATSSSEVVLKIIQEADKGYQTKDSLEKEPQSKGLLVDRKV